MRVRRTRLLSVLTGALAAAVMLAQPAMAAPTSGTIFSSEMTGDQVVPGPGDPDGFGTGRILIDSDAELICWDIDTENIETPLHGSLVHEGGEGQVGPVFYPLFGQTDDPDPDGCREDEAELIRDLLKNSAEFYLEIYNEAFDEGAIRGQVERQKSSVGTLAADVMTGDQVVLGSGDPDGTGSAKILTDPDAETICWDVDTENLEPPLNALIHQGAEGQEGVVVYRLFADTDDPDPNGCRSENGDLLRDLQKQSDLYLQIYNEQFPDGAIRGQLELL